MPLIAKFRVNPRNILSIWEGTEDTEAGSTSLGEWHDNAWHDTIPWIPDPMASHPVAIPRPCFSSATAWNMGCWSWQSQRLQIGIDSDRHSRDFMSLQQFGGGGVVMTTTRTLKIHGEWFYPWICCVPVRKLLIAHKYQQYPPLVSVIPFLQVGYTDGYTVLHQLHLVPEV